MSVKLLYIVLLVSLMPSICNAAECSGKVLRVLDWPDMCDGQLAYKLDSTNDKWVCALSNVGSSMVLAAYATNKTVIARTDDTQATSCTSLNQYHKPKYMYIHD